MRAKAERQGEFRGLDNNKSPSEPGKNPSTIVFHSACWLLSSVQNLPRGAMCSGNVFLHYCFRAEAKKLCWKGRSRVLTIVVATTPEGGVGIIEAVYCCFRIPARTAEGKLCWKCRSRATTIAIGMTPAKEARAARNKKRWRLDYV